MYCTVQYCTYSTVKIFILLPPLPPPPPPPLPHPALVQPETSVPRSVVEPQEGEGCVRVSCASFAREAKGEGRTTHQSPDVAERRVHSGVSSVDQYLLAHKSSGVSAAPARRGADQAITGDLTPSPRRGIELPAPLTNVQNPDVVEALRRVAPAKEEDVLGGMCGEGSGVSCCQHSPSHCERGHARLLLRLTL